VVQAFGGRGYCRDFAAERHFRHLRVDRIWEGTSEIMRGIVLNGVMKRDLRRLLY
jgi:alkylation response protein AidB-like acyl-CoA dehydrogenase